MECGHRFHFQKEVRKSSGKNQAENHEQNNRFELIMSLITYVTLAGCTLTVISLSCHEALDSGNKTNKECMFSFGSQ